jgi:ABC-type transporter Mla subunit MlaD
MIRKVSGLMLLIIGLAGVALAIVGFTVSERVVDAVVAALDSTLGLTGDSLATVEDTLSLAQTTIEDVNAGLATVEETADSLAQTIAETKPLLDQVGQITSVDAPNSIEAVQDAIPNVAEVAGVIDDTLITLNSFKIDQSILGVDIYYDLGINYEPTQPFDETVDQLGQSLDGLPDQLRGLEPSLQSASDNLDSVSQNIYAISDDLSTINGRIAEVNPLLTDYIGIVGNINTTIMDTQETISVQAGTAKLVLKVMMVWLGFMQFALLYLGWDLMTRREEEDEPEADTIET